MNLDRLKSAWQARDIGEEASSSEDGVTPLMERLAALERDVHRRDLREYLAACFVMAFFGWRAAATDDLLVRVGAIIVVAGSMFIILWSRRATVPARREPFAGDLPVARFCARELAKVEAQVRLLRSVWWWYVSPTIVGVLLMLVPKAPSLAGRVFTTLIVAGVGLAIHWLNVTTAKEQLEPLRDELRSWLDDLTAR